MMRRLSRRDIEEVRALPYRNIPTTYVTMRITTALAEGGFACVVSKKVARRAVDRNKIKRRIRAIFRMIDSHTMNIIVYPRSTVIKAPWNALVNDIISSVRSHIPIKDDTITV